MSQKPTHSNIDKTAQDFRQIVYTTVYIHNLSYSVLLWKRKINMNYCSELAQRQLTIFLQLLGNQDEILYCIFCVEINWNYNFCWFITPIHFGWNLFRHFGVSLFNFRNYFLWRRITDEGSVPEISIWSILLINSDLKWCIHLSRSLLLYSWK